MTPRRAIAFGACTVAVAVIVAVFTVPDLTRPRPDSGLRPTIPTPAITWDPAVTPTGSAPTATPPGPPTELSTPPGSGQ